MQFPKIKSVSALEKYKIHVEFLDGINGDLDLKNLADKGVFKNWDVENNFNKVSINPVSGAITWPCELDIDTIKIYCDVKGITVDEYLMKESHAAY